VKVPETLEPRDGVDLAWLEGAKEVELRVVGKAKPPLGDFMAEGGGWKGESPEEILRLLRETRAAGGGQQRAAKAMKCCSIPIRSSMRSTACFGIGI
jgi:hypothetical protein